MTEQVSKEKSEKQNEGSSGRRGFIRRVLGVAAGTAIAGLLLEKIGKIGIRTANAAPFAFQGDAANNGLTQTSLSTNTFALGGAFFVANGVAGQGVVGATEGAPAPMLIPTGVYGMAVTGNGIAALPTPGGLGAYGTARGTGGIGVEGEAGTAGVIPLVAKAAASQTANLQEWQNSGGTALSVVDASGKLGAGTSSPTASLHGQSSLPSGTAVNGIATGTGNTIGVYGESNAFAGVHGSGDYVGVWGTAFAGYSIPIIAQGATSQTGNLQEWRNVSGTALSVVDASGKLGVGIAAPVRQVHLQGNNAVFRMDRDANSSAFMLVRTAAGNFSTIWKTFYVGVNASGVNNGSFFIGDAGTNVSGPSTVRLAIDNSGNVGVGTEDQFGSGAGVLGIKNAGTTPTTNPTGGGVLYADAGAGKWRGSSGTVTTFGTAEPHCPKCGRDFMLEWQNPKYGHLQVCMWCFTHKNRAGVVKRENHNTRRRTHRRKNRSNARHLTTSRPKKS